MKSNSWMTGERLFLAGALGVSMVFGGVASSGYAGELERDPLFYELQAAEVNESELSDLELQAMRSLVVSHGDERITVGEVVAVGKLVWKIIEANEPVFGANLQRVSVLPKGDFHWSDFEGWSKPVVKKYSVTYRNFYGIEVVHFDFMLVYSYGGRADGVGRYLSQVGFFLLEPEVLWGFELDVQSEVGSVLNLGTKAEPLAGLEIGLTWKSGSLFSKRADAQFFFVTGEGEFEELSR